MNVKVYRKKDNSIMIYVNGSNGVSVGIGENVFTSKLTNGQNNALKEFFNKLNEIKGIDFKGSYEAHKEDKNKLDFDILLFITDIANVGGQTVESDGAYIVYKNKLLNLAEVC